MFEPGKSGNPSGRPRGSSGKQKYLTVKTALEEKNIDLLNEIIAIATNTEYTPELRAKCWLDLLKYCAPMLKAIQIAGEAESEGVTVNMNIGDFSEKLTEDKE